MPKTKEMEENFSSLTIDDKKDDFTKDERQLRRIFDEVDKNKFNGYFNGIDLSVQWHCSRNDTEPIKVDKDG